MQGKLIDGRYRGIAIGCYLEGGASGPKESARLVLEADGKVSVYVGSSSIGQGLETVCAQIAADALEMPMRRHQRRVPRLDRSRDRRLRLLQLALGGDGRQRDHGHGGRQAARRHSRGRRRAIGLRRARDRRSTPARRSRPDGRSLPLGELRRDRRRKRPMPATSAPTAMARMPPMSRSIPRPARWSCSTTSRSRMSAASSIR